MALFAEKLSYILPPFASLELLAGQYVHETNISNFIFYISFFNGYLFFRCLDKVFDKERNEINKEKVEELQQTIYSRKVKRKVKGRDDEVLGFDFVFGG